MIRKLVRYQTSWKIAAAAAVLLLMPVYVEAFWHGLAAAQSVFTSLSVAGGPGGISFGTTSNTVANFACTLNRNGLDPVFSNAQCLSIQMTYGMMDYTYDQSPPFTQGKTTSTALRIDSNGIGAGQRSNFDNNINCHGMGDCWAGVSDVTYAGADAKNGDEGQGWLSDSFLTQQTILDLATVSSVTRSSCNTTITQVASVIGASSPQTIQVGSSTGCLVNDWIVADQQVQSGNDNKEAVQITAVPDSTHITGIFRNNHLTSAPITPATVFGLSITSGIPGQLRTMVNLSSTPVTTGTVSSITGGAMIGTGTSWSTGMVGGTASNIGCIALSADDYNDGTNYNGSTFKSWYQITSVNSSTSIGIFSFSALGNQAYFGQGPVTPPHSGSIVNPASTYQIRPCVTLLDVATNGTVVVAETTSTTWNVGDNVEVAIAPYPDVWPFLYNIANYGPGGQLEVFFSLNNNGAHTINNGIVMAGNMRRAANTAGFLDWKSFIPFETGYECDGCATAFHAGGAIDQAIELGTNGVGGPSFVGSISGNTLTVISGLSGSIGPGQQVISAPNANNGTKVNPRTFILSGSGSTWTISGPPQTVAAQPMQFGVTDNSGKIDWDGVYIMTNGQNQGMDWQGVMSGTGGKLQIISNNVITGGGNASGLTFSGMIGTAGNTVGNLPTCSSSTEGYMVAIKDSTVNTWGSTITGGGADHVLAYCDGAAWTVAAK